MSGTRNKVTKKTSEKEQVAFIVNELLTSVIHYLRHDDITVDEVYQAFIHHFEMVDIDRAYIECASVCDLPERSKAVDFFTRRIDDFKNLIQAIFDVDWNTAPVQFVAMNLSKVKYWGSDLPHYLEACKVMETLQSRITERYEEKINELCDTVRELKNAVKELKSNSNVDGKKGPPTIPATSYSGVVKKTQPKPAIPKSTTTAKSRLAYREVLSSSENNWNHVKRRKQRKPPIAGTRTTDANNRIKSSMVKPTHVFVSRLDPSTKGDDLKAYLKAEHDWDVMDVEPLKAKFNTYTSFKVTINRRDNPVSAYLDPDKWPSGLLIRMYWIKRPDRHQK